MIVCAWFATDIVDATSLPTASWRETEPRWGERVGLLLSALDEPMTNLSVTIRLSSDCWRFLIDAAAEPTLRGEILASLEGAIEVPMNEGSAQLAVRLLEYLAAHRASMRPDDPGLTFCEQSVAAIEAALTRSKIP